MLLYTTKTNVWRICFFFSVFAITKVRFVYASSFFNFFLSICLYMCFFWFYLSYSYFLLLSVIADIFWYECTWRLYAYDDDRMCGILAILLCGFWWEAKKKCRRHNLVFVLCPDMTAELWSSKFIIWRTKCMIKKKKRLYGS